MFWCSVRKRAAGSARSPQRTTPRFGCRAAAGLPQAEGTGFLPAGQAAQNHAETPPQKKKHPLRVLLAVLLLLALAALGGGWYLTGGDLAALPERLKALRLPEWITLWQAHEPKPGARLI